MDFTQLANLGVAGMMILVYAKYIQPQLLAAFAAEQKAQREQHEEHMGKLLARIDRIEGHLGIANEKTPGS